MSLAFVTYVSIPGPLGCLFPLQQPHFLSRTESEMAQLQLQKVVFLASPCFLFAGWGGRGGVLLGLGLAISDKDWAFLVTPETRSWPPN